MKLDRYPKTYGEIRELFHDNPAAEAVARDLVGVRHILLRACDDLKHTAEQVGHALERDRPLLNSLGELQQKGPQFDVLCARYATLTTVLDAIAEVAGEEQETTA